MVSKTIVRARNYVYTFGVLAADLFAFAPVRAWSLLVGTIIAGIIYPLPFTMAGLTVQTYFSGEKAISLKLFDWALTLPLAAIGYATLALAVVATVLNFTVNHQMLRLLLKWQNNLLRRAVDSLPRYARLDCVRVPLQNRATELPAQFSASVRTAFIIERMISTGVHQFVVGLISLAMVIWGDWKTVLLLIAIAVLMAPLYAHVFSRIVETRRHMQSQAGARRDCMRVLIRDGILSGRDRALKKGGVWNTAEGFFSPTYGVIPRQVIWLNGIKLLAGTHILLAITLVVFLRADALPAMGNFQFVFAIALLLLLRSMMTLLSIFGRLTRNYTKLSQLRELFYPSRKPIGKTAKPGPAGRFRILDGAKATLDGAKATRLLGPGDHLFFMSGTCPAIEHAYQLAALTNVVQPLGHGGELRPSHLPYFTDDQLQLLNPDKTIAPEELSLELGEGVDAVEAGVQSVPIDTASFSAIAVSPSLWAQVRSDPAFENVRKMHTWFVPVSANETALEIDGDEPCLFLNGKGVGTLTTYGDAKARAQRVRQKQDTNDREPEDFDDDEM